MQHFRYTDNTPIGPELMREGVTSNLVLSQKRADNVMQYMTWGRQDEILALSFSV